MNRRRLVALGGVLAFVLIVGAVAVAANRSGGGSTQSTLPKLTYAAGQNKDLGAAQSAMAPAFAVTYEVRGTLPKLSDTAPAFTIREDASRARIDRVAAALGVPADHVQTDPTAKPTSAAGPTLVVFQGSWNLLAVPPDCSVSSGGVTTCSSTAVSTGTANASSAAQPPGDCPMPPCPAGQACAQVCPGKEGPVAIAPPAPPTPPARPADLPSRDEAERIGRAVLEKTGIDLAAAEVRVDDNLSLWSVTASPKVGGLPTQGLDTAVMIGPKGAIVGGYGSLVSFTKIGDYPLAGTAVGLDRLRAGRFAGPVPMAAGGVPVMAPTAGAGSGSGGTSTGSASPGTGSASPGTMTVAPSPPASAVPAPEPGPAPGGPEPVPPAPQKVVITGVHVALARSFGPTQDQRLLPVYVFETDPTSGMTGGRLPLFPVPAVTDALLATDTVPPIKP